VNTSYVPSIKACVFDDYGSLLDFNSAAMRCADEISDNAAQLSDIWRQKQLQHTWLCSLGGEHADLWEVTGDALNFSLAEVGIDKMELRERLMALYRELDNFPEFAETLRRRKDGDLHTAIRANNLHYLLDEVLSVEGVGVFKPDPCAYQLAVNQLDVAPEHMCIMSSSGWGAAGASTSSFKAVWINRFDRPEEHLREHPNEVIGTLTPLPAMLGLSES
jgi:2-haloacid dehalogenase